MAPDALAAREPATAEGLGEPRGAPPRAGALLARPWAIAVAVAVPLAVLYLALEPPSGDLAAATYRSDQFARVGLTLWDNGWYGGHYLPGYSLLAPALGALLGNRVLLTLCTVGAAGLFGLIAPRTFAAGGARIAAGSFALGISVTMLSGRVAFGLGLLVGLLAVVALQRGRVPIALALAVLTSLASPVAGAFLALAGLAYALTGGARRGLAVAAAALAPILALTLAFPEGGWEPFAPSLFWPGLAGVALIALLLPRVAGDLPPRTARTLAWGAWLYALALIGAYALRTPVGGNAARLGALFAAPLVAGALWGRRRPTEKEGPDRSRETRAFGASPRFGQPASGWLRHPLVLLALAIVLLYWQLETPLHDVSELSGDPSVHAAYYAPLLRELEHRAHGAPLRVEVPMMGSHWESAYLAEHSSILLARGWERQLDTRYGARFYEGPALTASAYRAWLHENAVAYVALPDVRLDYSAAAEGRLIARGLPYLRGVWRGPHWRLFAVVGAPPLAAVPAVLTGVGADSFTLAAPRPGSYAVRVRFTPYWALLRGSGCVRAAPGGWTVLDARAAGAIRVGIAFSLARVFDHGPRCTPSP
ncbi:MAG: hypothetical protein ACHQE6_08900 [Solirubrobacterales bacterium]